MLPGTQRAKTSCLIDSYTFRSIDNNTPLSPFSIDSSMFSITDSIEDNMYSPTDSEDSFSTHNNTINNFPFSYIEKKFDRKDFSVILDSYGSLTKFVLYDYFVANFENLKFYDLSPKNKYRKKIEGKGLEVFFLPRFSLENGHCLPYYRFTIHDCSDDMENGIRKLVEENGDRLTVSTLEVAIDFYGEDKEKLRRFLNSSFYQPYVRSEPFSYDETEYDCDLSKRPSRGIRCYPKPENDKFGLKCVRLEMVVNRRKLYKMEKAELEFPYSLEPFLELFDFSRLNFEKVIKRLRSYYKKQGVRKEKTIDKYIRDWFLFNDTLQKQYKALQKIDGRHVGRFLLPFPELKEALSSPEYDPSVPSPCTTSYTPEKRPIAPITPFVEAIRKRSYLRRENFFNTS